MADTFTTRLGLIQQGYGGNPETWGTELNNAMIALVDDAVAYEPITVNSDVTLTADDGLTNQVRRNLLVFTGDGGHTVTVKNVDRGYLVYNQCAADVTVKPDGGTGSVVRAGTCVVWCTDGSTSLTVDIPLDKIAKPEADVDFNGKKIVNAGKGSDPTDVATLENEFKDFAKPTADLDINGKKLTNVAKGTNTNDAATLANEIQHFAKPTAAMDMNGQKLTNVGAPSAPADAATKGYIDTLAASSDLGTVAAIAPQIVTLASIEDGTVATNALTTLAPIASEIVTVAGIDEAVVQLAGMFCGASTTDPATRFDGSPLQAGDYYLNTTGTPTVRVYSGSAWIPIEAVTLATPTEAETGVGDGLMRATDTGIALNSLRPRGYQEFLLSGTWHKPANANWVYVEMLGGGGGGGSGRRGGSSTAKVGGAGGGGAAFLQKWLSAADLEPSVMVAVGAGGAGGASITTSDTVGAPGADGGASSFGAHAVAYGGKGGAGGGSSATGGDGGSWGNAGTVAAKDSGFAGTSGSNVDNDRSTVFGGAAGGGVAAGGTTAAFPGSSSVMAGSGGGAGGGENNSNVMFQPSAGGLGGSHVYGGGGAAGTSHASAPTDGGDGVTFGTGGGGGGFSLSAPAGKGGDGGPGAGGGGGGATRNSQPSGAGGNGGDGFVRVWWG